jgi:hypothetical protein
LPLDFPNFETAFDNFKVHNPQWGNLLNNMHVLHECRDSRDDHFEERARLRHKQPTNSTRQDDDDFMTYDSANIIRENNKCFYFRLILQYCLCLS